MCNKTIHQSHISLTDCVININISIFNLTSELRVRVFRRFPSRNDSHLLRWFLGRTKTSETPVVRYALQCTRRHSVGHSNITIVMRHIQVVYFMKELLFQMQAFLVLKSMMKISVKHICYMRCTAEVSFWCCRLKCQKVYRQEVLCTNYSRILFRCRIIHMQR